MERKKIWKSTKRPCHWVLTFGSISIQLGAERPRMKRCKIICINGVSFYLYHCYYFGILSTQKTFKLWNNLVIISNAMKIETSLSVKKSGVQLFTYNSVNWKQSFKLLSHAYTSPYSYDSGKDIWLWIHMFQIYPSLHHLMSMGTAFTKIMQLGEKLPRTAKNTF